MHQLRFCSFLGFYCQSFLFIQNFFHFSFCCFVGATFALIFLRFFAVLSTLIYVHWPFFVGFLIYCLCLSFMFVLFYFLLGVLRLVFYFSFNFICCFATTIIAFYYFILQAFLCSWFVHFYLSKFFFIVLQSFWSLYSSLLLVFQDRKVLFFQLVLALTLVCFVSSSLVLQLGCVRFQIASGFLVFFFCLRTFVVVCLLSGSFGQVFPLIFHLAKFF